MQALTSNWSQIHRLQLSWATWSARFSLPKNSILYWTLEVLGTAQNLVRSVYSLWTINKNISTDCFVRVGFVYFPLARNFTKSTPLCHFLNVVDSKETMYAAHTLFEKYTDNHFENHKHNCTFSRSATCIKIVNTLLDQYLILAIHKTFRMKNLLSIWFPYKQYNFLRVLPSRQDGLQNRNRVLIVNLQVNMMPQNSHLKRK